MSTSSNFYKWDIYHHLIPHIDSFIAECWQQRIEGIEEDNQMWHIFCSEENKDEFETFLKEKNIYTEPEVLVPRNWNEQWENSFEPIVVEGIVTIRAAFHPESSNEKEEIIITPKMSFGTGHHPTTRLMLQEMNEISFNEKLVFDFGTGTGILAVFAEKRGAQMVMAIDNDPWSIANAQENVAANNSSKITVSNQQLEEFKGTFFDIILANINRHILLKFLPQLIFILQPNGRLLLSGILKEDEEIIHATAQFLNLTLVNVRQETVWSCMHYTKNKVTS